jgi:hypothetical protein
MNTCASTDNDLLCGLLIRHLIPARGKSGIGINLQLGSGDNLLSPDYVAASLGSECCKRGAWLEVPWVGTSNDRSAFVNAST